MTGNAVVADDHFKLLTEMVEKMEYFKHSRVGRLGLGDRRALGTGVSLARLMSPKRRIAV